MNTHSSAKGGYLAGVDGLRAVAVLSVLIYHLKGTLLPGGFTGVDIFFVISGYVVTRSLLDYYRPDEGIGTYLAAFYARRVARLLPVLVVCLVATSVVTVLFVPIGWLGDNITGTGPYAFFGLSNLALLNIGENYYTPRAEFNPFTHTWSLGVEEQFYLLFPLVAYLAMRFGARAGWRGFAARLLLPALTAASLAYAWYETPVDATRAFYLLTSRFWELGLGCLLCQLHAAGWLRPRSARVAQACLAAGIALLVASVALLSGKGFPFPGALLPVAGALLTITGVVGAVDLGGRWAILLDNALMVRIGKLSYSIYLWHWPVFVLFRWTFGLEGPIEMLVAVLIVARLSTLSYRLVEVPMRSRGMALLARAGVAHGVPAPAAQSGARQHAASLVRAATSPKAVVLATAAALVGAGVGANYLLFDKRVALSRSVTRDVQTWFSLEWPVPPDANGVFKGRTLFIVGDSHAFAYSTMVQLLRQRDQMNVHLIHHAGCAVPALVGPASPECAQYAETALREVEQRAAPGDVVFLPGLRLPRVSEAPPGQSLQTMLEEFRAPVQQEFRRAGLQEAKQVIARLQARSLRVVLEAPKPVFRTSAYRCSDWFNSRNPACAGGSTMPRPWIEQYRAPVLDSMQALKKEFPALVVWDPLPVLCPQPKCRAMDDGVPLFMDSDHVSGHGNHVLYRPFRALLGSLYFADMPEYRSVPMNVAQLEAVSTTGLSDAEPWGRWTDGQRTEFRFVRPLPAGPFKVVLETRGAFGFIAGKDVEVQVGEVTQHIVAPPAPATIEVPFPQGAAGADALELHFPPLKSPKQMGTSEDSRLLGLQLVNLRIVPLVPGPVAVPTAVTPASQAPG